MSDKDGGPAFPHDVTAYVGVVKFTGMTLRDYFASAALKLIVADAMQMLEIKENATDNKIKKMTNAEYAAMNAYVIADAMLREREK